MVINRFFYLLKICQRQEFEFTIALALEVQVALVEPVAQVLLEEAEVVLHGLALEVDLATR
jgi:hypothetical protein